MTTPLVLLMAVLGFLAAGLVLVYHVVGAAVWGVSKVARGVGFLVRHTLGFVKDETLELVQTTGALLSTGAILPLALGNLVIGRVASAKHYGRALGDEVSSSVVGLYRLGLAHPLRFLGLGSVVDRVEDQIPDLVDRAPHDEPLLARRKMVEPPAQPRRAAKRPAARMATEDGDFPGYEVVGELPAGGSGARLFLARPDRETRARIEQVEREAEGQHDLGQVVIKSFAIAAGSTLPQIVREGRALEAARKLGLVLQHSLDEERFWYVMPYVRGRELGDVTTSLHVRCGAQGLDDDGLRRVASYTGDVLTSLERFHADGLWHKDVKPSNVMVAEERAHLVDLGLVTPLASAMTLTTHGTEYYRDPELVRQALRGAKVNEVDGVKFDLYAVGALLYSMLENSFPAHGNLSRITKRCPEALSFVVRRAMADHADRYASAEEMRADLAVLGAAKDPFAVLPAALPSFQQALRAELEGPGDESPAPVRERTLRAPAASPKRAADKRAAGKAERAAKSANASSTPFQEAVESRKRHRSRHGLATFAVMFCSVLALTKVLPAILDSGDGHHGWFADRLREAETAMQRAEERRALEAASEETQAEVARRRAEEVRSRWADEVYPLVEDSETLDLPTWSRGANVLILNDVLKSDRPESLEPLALMLEQAGYGVLGSVLGRADSDLALDLEAAARHALRLSETADEASLDRLQAFLDANEELDAVIWFAHDESLTSQRYLLLSSQTGLERETKPFTIPLSGSASIAPGPKVVQQSTFYGIR